MSDYLDVKLKIYEAFDNGYITESEKDDLLTLCEDSKEKDDNEDDEKEKRKKIAKTITLIISLITFILSLPILYIAINDVKHKAKWGKDDINKLKKYREDLSKLRDKTFDNTSDIDDIRKEALKIYDSVRIYAGSILTYAGTPVQKSKGKKLINDINKSMSWITGNTYTINNINKD